LDSVKVVNAFDTVTTKQSRELHKYWSTDGKWNWDKFCILSSLLQTVCSRTSEEDIQCAW